MSNFILNKNSLLPLSNLHWTNSFKIRHYSSSKKEDDSLINPLIEKDNAAFLVYFLNRLDYHDSKKLEIEDFDVIGDELLEDLRKYITFYRHSQSPFTEKHKEFFNEMVSRYEDLKYGLEWMKSQGKSSNLDLKPAWIKDAKSFFLELIGAKK